MAISTYSELTAAVLGWADRSGDTSASTQVDNFIALAEVNLNLRLRLRQMEATATLTPDANGVASLPTDFLELRRLTWTGNPRRDLDFVEPKVFEYAYPDRPSDSPRTYTIEAGSIKVGPVSTTDLELLYYQKITGLSSGSPTNWLLTAYPNVYLWGTLVQLYAWARDSDGVQLAQAALEGAIDAATRLETQMRAPSAIRASTVVV